MKNRNMQLLRMLREQERIFPHTLIPHLQPKLQNTKEKMIFLHQPYKPMVYFFEMESKEIILR